MQKLILILILTSFGCAPVSKTNDMSSYLVEKEQTDLTAPDISSEGPSTVVQTSMKICSKLDLTNIVWPSDIGKDNWPVYFALALNLTGSFEGRDGWKNITNNFDGQGMSLGLMQQNFGQGTLQPLLIKSIQKDSSNMKKIFTSGDYASLKTMLEDWGDKAIATQSLVRKLSTSQEELFAPPGPINALDIGGDLHFEKDAVTTQAVNVSVQWAATHLYSGSAFIPRWKKSFQDLAITAAYRTSQVEADKKIFLKAKDYLTYFKFTELRSLLFLFDVAVQNGGFTDEHKAAYKSWLTKNPNSTEKARLLALLEARLTTVNSKYIEDVRSRKTSIILGTGKVHGTSRNYPTEYCFDNLAKIK